MAREMKYAGMSFPHTAQRGPGDGLRLGDYLALVEKLSLVLAETLELMQIVMRFVTGGLAACHVLP